LTIDPAAKTLPVWHAGTAAVAHSELELSRLTL
jgi:hypothetical protein